MKIKDLLINKVESQEKTCLYWIFLLMKPLQKVIIHENFINFSDAELENFYNNHGFALGLDDLKFIQEYFKTEERNPTETELKVLDTYWSDHCRHTTFETELSDIQFEGKFKHTLETIFNDYIEKRKFLGRELKPISLMDLATVCGKYFHKTGNLDNLVISDEINACTIQIEAEYDGKKNLGIYYSKTKPTITQRKLNLSEERLPVWEELSEILYPEDHLYSRR